jgi:hypothetical protein
VPRRRKWPQTLQEVDLRGRIKDGTGKSPAQAGEFFGWEPTYVTKSAADFTKDELLSQGWTKDKLLDLAEAYQHIARITPTNPSAAGRARQLREIAKILE